MAKKNEKTLNEHIKSAGSYIVPAGAIGSALAVIIGYYLSMPEHVETALATLLTIAVNLILVYARKK